MPQSPSLALTRLADQSWGLALRLAKVFARDNVWRFNDLWQCRAYVAASRSVHGIAPGVVHRTYASHRHTTSQHKVIGCVGGVAHGGLGCCCCCCCCCWKLRLFALETLAALLPQIMLDWYVLHTYNLSSDWVAHLWGISRRRGPEESMLKKTKRRTMSKHENMKAPPLTWGSHVAIWYLKFGQEVSSCTQIYPPSGLWAKYGALSWNMNHKVDDDQLGSTYCQTRTHPPALSIY